MDTTLLLQQFMIVLKNITLDYTQIQEGVDYKMRLDDDFAMLDIDAARNQLGQNTAVVGYCYGGMLTHIAASRLTFDCAVSYYGGMIADNYLDLKSTFRSSITLVKMITPYQWNQSMQLKKPIKMLWFMFIKMLDMV